MPRLSRQMSHLPVRRKKVRLENLKQIKMLAGFAWERNDHLDTKCMLELIRKVVSEVGAHKVVFGSGFPIRCPRAAVASYLGSGLNDLQLESVFSLNFKQLTGLN